MEDFNIFCDDFLSNGEFHQFYTTFDSHDDICLWDNRIDFDLQQKWNFTGDCNFERSNCSDCTTITGCTHFNISDSNTSSNLNSSNNNSRPCSERDHEKITELFLTDLDEWKQNHLDNLLYQSNNNNELELNLENLINENPYNDSAFNVCDLPARTFYCSDSCNNYLKETSEHLDLSLRTFQSYSTVESTIETTTHPNFNNLDHRTYAGVAEEKEFICNYGECRKVYAKAGHLKAHIRRHIGDKPYVCHWPNCTWKFSRSDELSRHRRSHSGIKPYDCDLCSKKFSRSDHLSKHRKVHERKMAAMKIKATWIKLPPRKPGRKPKCQSVQQ